MAPTPKRWGTAWVVGASSGIGRELASALSGRADHVAASARSAGKLDDLAASKPNIGAYTADVTDAEGLASCVAAIEASGGPVDLAVFCAAQWKMMKAQSLDRDTVAEMFDVNYMGVVNAIQAVLPGMLARRSGHVVIVASVAGYRGLPRSLTYGPTKAALINLAEALKIELEPEGIAVSLVNPGFVDTPLTENNPFPMPDLITAKQAAEHILAGLDADRFEIAFPWRFTRVLKLLRILPYGAYFAVIRRTVARRRKG